MSLITLSDWLRNLCILGIADFLSVLAFNNKLFAFKFLMSKITFSALFCTLSRSPLSLEKKWLKMSNQFSITTILFLWCCYAIPQHTGQACSWLVTCKFSLDLIHYLWIFLLCAEIASFCLILLLIFLHLDSNWGHSLVGL